jgi:hypothetical protein
MDPVVLSSVTAAVSILASEYIKGFANETGKATWAGVKSLLGWKSDPDLAEIPQKIATSLSSSQETAAKLLELLKGNDAGSAAALVGKIEVNNGKLVIVHTIIAKRVEF